MAGIKKQLDALLTQEMDRKSFLRYSGGILLAVLGVTGLIRLLLSSSKTSVLADPRHKPTGYGSSRYGQ